MPIMIRPMIRVTALLCSMLLAGCGFTPLYGEAGQSAGVTQTLAAVDVGPVPDRLGQVVRNSLVNRMAPRGGAQAAAYRLDLTLDRSVEGYGFEEDAAITRENLRLVASYRLTDLARGAVVLEGVARANAAYDVVQSDYATFSATQDAERRTADAVVEEIHTRLALYFRANGR